MSARPVTAETSWHMGCFATGSTSYEINLPNGGRSYVIGNIIEQGPMSPNGGGRRGERDEPR